MPYPGQWPSDVLRDSDCQPIWLLPQAKRITPPSDFLTTPHASGRENQPSSDFLTTPQTKRTALHPDSEPPKCKLDLRFLRVNPPKQDICPPQPNTALAAATKEQERVSKTIKRQVFFFLNIHHFSIRRAARRECAVTMCVCVCVCVCVLPCLLHTQCVNRVMTQLSRVWWRNGARREKENHRGPLKNTLFGSLIFSVQQVFSRVSPEFRSPLCVCVCVCVCFNVLVISMLL